MLMVGAFGLACLAAFAYRVGRHPAFPPFVLAGVWSVLLFVLALFADSFYAVAGEAVVVALYGALAFVCGGLLACLVELPARAAAVETHAERRRWDRLLKLALAGLLLLYPVYFRQVLTLTAGLSGPSIWWNVRHGWLQAQAEGRDALGFADNLPLVAIVTALLCAYQVNGGRRTWVRAAGACVLALSYQLLSATIAGAFGLIASVAGFALMRGVRLSARRLLAVGCAGLAAFAFIAWQVGKGYADPTASFSENLPAIGEAFALYLVGPLVAFGRYLDHPDLIPAAWHPLRIPLLIANRFGANFAAPSLHAAYTSVGDGLDQNVYTMYFAYVPYFGYAGTALWLAVLGFAVTLMYRAALTGSRLALVLASMSFSGLLHSGFNEQFLLNLDPYLKSTVLVLAMQAYASRGGRRVVRRVGSVAHSGVHAG